MRAQIDVKLVTGTGLIFLWTVAAFFLILSPLSESIHFRLPFRDVNVPIAYWIWVLTGFFALSLILRKDSPKEALKTIIPTAVIFHLIALTPRLITNPNLYALMDKRYLAYVFLVICLAASLAALWAVRSLTQTDMKKAVLRLPLLFLPFISFLYCAYKGNRPGMVIFALSALLPLTAFPLKRFFERLISVISAAFRYMRRNKKLLVAAIFLFAFVVRIAFSLTLIAKTGEEYPLASDDGDSYSAIAESIMNSPKDTLKIVAAQDWPPVYLVFLGTIYLLFGRNFYIVVIIQSLLGASIAVFSYILARKIFNETTGIIAGLLVALSQPLIFVSAILGTEALYVPLVILAIFVASEALFFGQKKIYLKMALSGILFGLAAMTLYAVTLFPILAFLFIICYRGLRQPMRSRLKIASLFLACFLGIFVLIKAVCALETGAMKGGYEDAARIQWARKTTGYTYEVDPDNRKFIALGIEPFTKPVESVKIAVLSWKKVLLIGLEVFPVRISNFFTWPNFGYFDPVLLANPARLSSRFGSNLEFYTLLIFFTGLFLSLKNKNNRGVLLFLLLFVSYYALLHTIPFACHTLRYSCPVKPFLILLLSYGLFRGYRYFSNTQNAS